MILFKILKTYSLLFHIMCLFKIFLEKSVHQIKQFLVIFKLGYFLVIEGFDVDVV